MGNKLKCATCCRPVASPYRSFDGETGKIVEGCIDEAHTGHLHGASLAWHNRKEAKAYRRKIAARLTALLGTPFRGFGIPA